jgi:hypothetical protein
MVEQPETAAEAVELLRLLVAYDDEAKPNGIMDCVDNTGSPYQSAGMAGLITRARMLANPFDLAAALATPEPSHDR